MHAPPRRICVWSLPMRGLILQPLIPQLTIKRGEQQALEVEGGGGGERGLASTVRSDTESGPLRAVHLSRHKWPGEFVN